ncbi:unnamed protein product [Acanthoscelides obtectus]|uniref:USP8 dimerisation domain-containing protein n=1 Tax=Acanthoscelides obtectus TaxID=200917 RepID=A0A9P0LH69_ACAOB|nr:unnamed protein product [Acanthoscelides obtectus]CAK1651823.1 STAM-binding protein-like A [Acanthoscelides obtectus]
MANKQSSSSNMSQIGRTPLKNKLDPQERLKQLIDYSNQVDVDPNVAPKRYYRSGIEMIRMANVYYKEGSLENAYVLYIKFMTLFLEKIRKHPDFLTVPVEEKARNQAMLRDVLPKAETLKQQLLQQYQNEYRKYLNEMKQLKLDRKKNEDAASGVDEKSPSKQKSSSIVPVTPCRPSPTDLPVVMPEVLDDVSYPDPDLAPPRPSAPSPPLPSVISDSRIVGIPSIDRSTKPSTDPGRFDSGTLRTYVVPGKVMTLFQL